MTATSIATFTAASTSPVSPSAPVLVSTLPTGTGADVHVYRDTDGSLSSECTGCGEYAWTLRVTHGFAQEHAATCLRRPRPLAA